MITLSDGTTTIELPADMRWENEWWSGLVQSTSYSIEGALFLEQAQKQAGRPITLASPPDQAVLSRALVLQISTWENTPTLRLTLVINASTFTVVFDHTNKGFEPAIIGSWSTGDDLSNALYTAKLRFLEVSV